MKHKCHAFDCQKHCRPEFLMCGYHWSKVPKTLAAEVYAHYRVGQCDDKRVSTEWLKAADNAIEFIRKYEGK